MSITGCALGKCSHLDMTLVVTFCSLLFGFYGPFGKQNRLLKAYLVQRQFFVGTGCSLDRHDYLLVVTHQLHVYKKL